MKIIDCFLFYNELDLLKYRLNALNHVVDFFVLIEATNTYVGKEKELFFFKNKDSFEEFNKKIIHIIVDDLPFKNPDIQKGEQWKNEHFQRNCIDRGLNKLDLIDEDIIIIGDVDEIPDPETISKIKNKIIQIQLNKLEMDFYYYNLNTKLDEKWSNSVITTKRMKQGNLPENLRGSYLPPLHKGGWHLSFFGDTEFIKNKLINFSHQEFNKESITSIENINEKVKNSADIFSRNGIGIKKIPIEENDYLPYKYEEYFLENFCQG